jgi:hypothetical protein
MPRRGHKGRGTAAATAAALALFVLPPASSASDAGFLNGSSSRLAGTTLSIKDPGDPEILDRVVLRGAIPVPGPGQRVTVTVWREGKVVRSRKVRTNRVTGRYRMPLRLKGCCRHVAQAVHGSDVSSSLPFSVSVPGELVAGDRRTLLFNRLLSRAGIHMGDLTDQVDESTALGIMAFRKVHGFDWTETYDPALFELLLRGRDARFQPAHDESGRHVEVDISRQVMALVEDGVATDVFHVSTGSGGTPRGEWTFYDKVPGYNAIGMYYSAFYDGDYATHGYSSVPTYPASHGCTRNPIPYSVFIYDWIDIGDTIYVYD